MNNIFELMKEYQCEELHFRYDQKTGLRTIIAINNTELADVTSGGARLYDYKTEDDALADVLKLSQAMTYKCAAADINLGGSKAVLWNTEKQKSIDLLKIFGKFVNDLGGRFRTAVDLGLSNEDGRVIKEVCPYIEGESDNNDGFDCESDVTALGVIKAMKVGMKFLNGSSSLDSVTIAIQGLGYVGGYLVEFLQEENAKIIATDIKPELIDFYRKKYPEIVFVEPDQIISQKCDIFCPSAIGGIINIQTIPLLNCTLICGAANNQLLNPESDIFELAKRKILYLPDFIANAGGIIQADVEIKGGTKQKAIENTQIIEKNIEFILNRYKNSDLTTIEIANELVKIKLLEKKNAG